MIDRHSVIGQNHFEAPYKDLLNESRKMIGAKKDLLNTTPDVNTMNNSISL